MDCKALDEVTRTDDGYPKIVCKSIDFKHIDGTQYLIEDGG